MRNVLQLVFKAIIYTQRLCLTLLSYLYAKFIIYVFDIKHGKRLKINGFPRFILDQGANITIGDDYKMNSGMFYNPIGRNMRSLIRVSQNGTLTIGNNVGMSSIAIICHKSITIADNVRIGGNTVIYDTDFHSLNAHERTARPEIKANIQEKEIIIESNVFIGSHCTILKGVTIGSNTIIGAGSIVSKSIPRNEIWAGNPIRFIGNARL